MNILIGVSASIAIYRTCDLVRELRKRGYGVRVVMSRAATEWISPVLFEALSDQKVFTADDNTGAAMPHIDIREGIDLYLIAPATANTIAKAAAGMADDLLLATLLSYDGPRWLAPSMNPFMYEHPATRKNTNTLIEYGYRILDPREGAAVCGDEGKGKMMSVDDIINEIVLFGNST